MRVVIADDSVLLRAGLARLLEDAGFDVVAQAARRRGPPAQGSRPPARRRRHGHPHAADAVRRGPARGAADPRGAARSRGARPLAVHRRGLRGRAAAGQRRGIGYLLKDRVSDIAAFTDALRRVGEGGSALDPEVVSQLLGRRRANDPLDRLTPREREVLGHMAQGRSNGAIARELVVTDRAIEKHVTCIFSKLGLSAADDGHRRVLAVLAYLKG